MPRPSNTAARQAQIVDGLLTVLATQGYEGASVADVARAAGLATGLVHYHFPSKQAILLRALEVLEERLAARLDARTAGAKDPRAALRAFVDVHLARGKDAAPDELRCWVQLGAEAIRQPEVGARYGEVVARARARLEALVRAALAAEGRSTRGAARVAAAGLALVQGYVQLAATAPDAIPLARPRPPPAARFEALLDAEPRA